MTTASKQSSSSIHQPVEEAVINQEEVEEQLLEQAVLRLNGHVLGIVLGIICGLVIFVATNWLVIKGGPVVGPHLGLLSHYFIGYSVTFVGSFVGLLYGFLTGYICGFLVAFIYNRVVLLKGPKNR
jgi:hypothetical protein